MNNSYIEINKKTYDEVAEDLVQRHKRVGINEPTPEDYFNKIFQYLNNKDNIKYLEIGPGDGNVLKYFAKRNIETYAIEISSKMAELCKKVSPNTKLIIDNILNVKFEKKFDIIFAGSFIHLFPQDDLKIVMNKIYNWLDDKGILFLYTTSHLEDKEGYFSKDKTNYKKENIRYRHYFTKKSLSELLIKYKFNILEHYEIDEPENNRIWQFVVARKH